MTTVLNESEVPYWVGRLIDFRRGDLDRLERVHQYLRDPDIQTMQRSSGSLNNGPLRWLKPGTPDDVKRLAEMSRVNMLKFVVNAVTQVLYVDGYRVPKEENEAPAWETWQRNRMNAGQIGVHRSALSYGVSYVSVLPGDPVSVIQGASPRKMTAVYGDDKDWPEFALERRRSDAKDVKLYRLYDAMNCWWVEVDSQDKATVVKDEQHNAGVCPVVRFISTIDEDGIIEGEVEPLIPIQDQINVTTFGLLVAQHYGAFRQRYIMGWVADTEEEALNASARKLWAFEDTDVTVGEFSQTDLSGYINSREASLRHLATISQTPAHELLGQLVNLSAEALTAAEASHRRKVEERQTSFGESWEQVLELATELDGATPDPLSFVRWRDTEARSLSQVADALTKLVAGLGVPAQELWDKIPGVTQQEVNRWKATADENRAADPVGQLAAELQRQSAGA